MMVLGMVCGFWRECFEELSGVAKFLFSVMIAIVSILAVPLFVLEFVLFDIWILLLALLSDNMTVSGIIDFMFFM